jgi:hypothetical protein
MNIIEIHATESPEMIKVVTDDMGELWVPQPCETWHNAEIQAWLEAGGEIQPYVPPPPPPERSVQDKLAAAGLTVDELRDALGIS